MTHNQDENSSQIPYMLELADEEFKVTTIIRLKILQKKMDRMGEYMGIFNKEKEALERN